MERLHDGTLLPQAVTVLLDCGAGFSLRPINKGKGNTVDRELGKEQ
jgi:hypothetical protein